MQFVSFDLETFLIQPGLAAPKMVCLSAVCGDGSGEHKEPLLFARQEGLEWIKYVLEHSKEILIGQNVFFDLGVICAEDPKTFVPLVFQAFDQNRIRDTIIRQQLLDIANGDFKYREIKGVQVKNPGYSLAALSIRLLNKVLPKEGTWRLRYGTLDGIPVSKWPYDARKYAIDDALTTWEVFCKQAPGEGEVIPCEERATREAWSLWLMSAWGIRTDGAAVEKLKVSLQKEQTDAITNLASTGVYKKKKDGSWSKDMKTIYAKVAAGFQSQGRVMPVTPKSKFPDNIKPSSDHEALEESGDPDLRVLADAGKGAKVLNTFVPLLEQGTKVAINARFNALVESYRTSCSRPNLQNLPRKGGARECFVARQGRVFVSVDYDTIELRALAQSCIDLKCKFRNMADALSAGEDLHLNLAADFLSLPRDEAKKRHDAGDIEISENRQLAKIANFGFPGGLSPDTFVAYAKGFGVVIAVEKSRSLYKQWKKSWPEMEQYFSLMQNIVGGQNDGTITSPRSGFVRGGVSFTQAANHFFQSLTATGAKDALWHVCRECYTDRKSPLWGSRPVAFIHDEIISEVPEDRAAEAAERQAQIMIEIMSRWIVDVPIKASPVLMRRWLKGAKPVRVNGKLVPSRPRESGGKVTWEPDL